MKLDEKKVKDFEVEKHRFLEEMKKALLRYPINMEIKKKIYSEIIMICKSVDLKEMQIRDSNHQKLIKTEGDLLMAIGWYWNKLRNVFIKKFKKFHDPFKTIVVEHEERIAAILEGYI